MGNGKNTAVLLAAGRGSRMKSDTPKQFLKLGGNPLICHSLRAFEESFMDEVILAVPAGTEDYCREEIVGKSGFRKVSRVISGGEERFISVMNALKAIESAGGCEYVYIHDGARPFLDADILDRARRCVAETGACAAGMPVKDTIRIVDDMNLSAETPDRRFVWQMQTPQAFSFPLILEAYGKLFSAGDAEGITDDACVLERALGRPVRLFEGSYRNIKVTTPEDLIIAEALFGN